MTGGTSVAKSSAWPTASTSTAPATRSTSLSKIASCVSTRAAAEHFWPAYVNAEWTTAGTTSSRSASESTITQFLPPISATTRLTWPCPSGVSAALRTISRPTAPPPPPLDGPLPGGRLGGAAHYPRAPAPGAGERDHVHARVAHERGARL